MAKKKKGCIAVCAVLIGLLLLRFIFLAVVDKVYSSQQSPDSESLQSEVPERKQSKKRKTKKTQTIEEVCKVYDYDTAHQLLDKLRQVALDDSDDEEFDRSREKYLNALRTVYSSELTYIVLNFPEDADVRIMFRMNEMLPLGEVPKEGLVHSSDIRDSYSNLDGYNNISYEKWVRTYNFICNKLFDVAVMTKNKNLALVAVSLVKENVEFFKGEHYGDKASQFKGVKVDGDYGYVYFVKTDIDAIKKRYDEAVKSGVFN